MKKIIYSLVIMIAAGSLFTSCIENVEPAGVLALRQAKAKYIESLTTLKAADAVKVQAEAAVDQAQAKVLEAQIAVVNAEAAYRQAEAAYKEAEAKVKEAEAKKVAAEVDAIASQAQADAAVAQAQADLLKAQAEAAKAQVEAQALTDKTIAEAQADLLKAQAELIRAQAVATQKQAEADAYAKAVEADANAQKLQKEAEAALIAANAAAENEKIEAQAKAEALAAQAQIAMYEAETARAAAEAAAINDTTKAQADAAVADAEAALRKAQAELYQAQAVAAQKDADAALKVAEAEAYAKATEAEAYAQKLQKEAEAAMIAAQSAADNDKVAAEANAKLLAAQAEAALLAAQAEYDKVEAIAAKIQAKANQIITETGDDHAAAAQELAAQTQRDIDEATARAAELKVKLAEAEANLLAAQTQQVENTQALEVAKHNLAQCLKDIAVEASNLTASEKGVVEEYLEAYEDLIEMRAILFQAQEKFDMANYDNGATAGEFVGLTKDVKGAYQDSIQKFNDAIDFYNAQIADFKGYDATDFAAIDARIDAMEKELAQLDYTIANLQAQTEILQATDFKDGFDLFFAAFQQYKEEHPYKANIPEEVEVSDTIALPVAKLSHMFAQFAITNHVPVVEFEMETWPELGASMIFNTTELHELAAALYGSGDGHTEIGLKEVVATMARDMVVADEFTKTDAENFEKAVWAAKDAYEKDRDTLEHIPFKSSAEYTTYSANMEKYDDEIKGLQDKYLAAYKDSVAKANAMKAAKEAWEAAQTDSVNAHDAIYDVTKAEAAKLIAKAEELRDAINNVVSGGFATKSYDDTTRILNAIKEYMAAKVSYVGPEAADTLEVFVGNITTADGVVPVYEYYAISDITLDMIRVNDFTPAIGWSPATGKSVLGGTQKNAAYNVNNNAQYPYALNFNNDPLTKVVRQLLMNISPRTPWTNYGWSTEITLANIRWNEDRTLDASEPYGTGLSSDAIRDHFIFDIVAKHNPAVADAIAAYETAKQAAIDAMEAYEEALTAYNTAAGKAVTAYNNWMAKVNGWAAKAAQEYATAKTNYNKVYERFWNIDLQDVDPANISAKMTVKMAKDGDGLKFTYTTSLKDNAKWSTFGNGHDSLPIKWNENTFTKYGEKFVGDYKDLIAYFNPFSIEYNVTNKAIDYSGLEMMPCEQVDVILHAFNYPLDDAVFFNEDWATYYTDHNATEYAKCLAAAQYSAFVKNYTDNEAALDQIIAAIKTLEAKYKAYAELLQSIIDENAAIDEFNAKLTETIYGKDITPKDFNVHELYDLVDYANGCFDDTQIGGIQLQLANEYLGIIPAQLKAVGDQIRAQEDTEARYYAIAQALKMLYAKAYEFYQMPASASDYEEMREAVVAYYNGILEDMEAAVENNQTKLAVYTKALELLEMGYDPADVYKKICADELELATAVYQVALDRYNVAKAAYDAVMAQYIN